MLVSTQSISCLHCPCFDLINLADTITFTYWVLVYMGEYYAVPKIDGSTGRNEGPRKTP